MEGFSQLSIFSSMQDFDLMFTNSIPYVGFFREEPFFPRGGPIRPRMLMMTNGQPFVVQMVLPKDADQVAVFARAVAREGRLACDQGSRIREAAVQGCGESHRFALPCRWGDS